MSINDLPTTKVGISMTYPQGGDDRLNRRATLRVMDEESGYLIVQIDLTDDQVVNLISTTGFTTNGHYLWSPYTTETAAGQVVVAVLRTQATLLMETRTGTGAAQAVELDALAVDVARAPVRAEAPTTASPPERAHQVYTDVLARGGLTLDAVTAACRVARAEELRHIADHTGYGWAIATSLRARADELDPAGANISNPDGP